MRILTNKLQYASQKCLRCRPGREKAGTRKKMLDSYNLFPNIHLGFDNKITLRGVPSVSEGSHTGAIFFIITDNVKNRKFNV